MIYEKINKSTDYCVYVGRTNSVSRRVGEYSAPFQMHSPNDFKLRFFEEQLRQLDPQAVLSLYFKPMLQKVCSAEEIRLIAIFTPLINLLGRPNQQDREVIQNVYREYYWSAFRRGEKR